MPDIKRVFPVSPALSQKRLELIEQWKNLPRRKDIPYLEYRAFPHYPRNQPKPLPALRLRNPRTYFRYRPLPVPAEAGDGVVSDLRDLHFVACAQAFSSKSATLCAFAIRRM